MPRFARTSFTDVNVRAFLGVPSLDCYVRRKRLLYLSRLYEARLPVLNVLLQQRSGVGQKLPFIRTILDDLEILRSAVAPRLDSLPQPAVDPGPWWHLLGTFQREWRSIVMLYHTYLNDDDNVYDMQSPGPAELAQRAVAFPCAQCGLHFKSSKAMRQHARIKHKARSVAALTVPDITVCPICGTNFHSRLCLVTHLSDRRVRSKIRNTSCAIEYENTNPPGLTNEQLRIVDDEARRLRKRSLEAGHTHHIQRMPAVRPKRVDAGIPQHLLTRCHPQGARRRLFQKTSSIIGNVRLLPKKVAPPTPIVYSSKYRVSVKSHPARLF